MDEENLYLIDELLRRILFKYEAIESKNRAYKHLKDLTITEIKTIFAIGEDDPKTMKEIAQTLNVSVSTPTTTIDRLIDKDYVDRFTGVEDRRQVLVRLTNKGKKILKEIQDIKIETTQFILNILTDSEIEFMKDILMKIDKGIEA